MQIQEVIKLIKAANTTPYNNEAAYKLGVAFLFGTNGLPKDEERARKYLGC